MSRSPWLIVLLYVALSTLWMAVAGYLISLMLEDPALRSRAYLAKELVLIAISSILFYALLKLGKGATTAREADVTAADVAASAAAGFRLNRLMLAFFSLAMMAPIISIMIIKMYGPEIEQGAYADLQTIVDLKAEQIELWLAERHNDAEALLANQALIEQVVDLKRRRNAHELELIRNRLEAVRQAYSYESVILLDVESRPLLVLGEKHELPPITRELLSTALRSRQIQSTDFFLDENGKPLLDIAVPLVAETTNKEPGAIVLLRADLEQFLLPLVEKWPRISCSGEILLITQKNETVNYLNKLHRFQRTHSTHGYHALARDELASAIATRDEKQGTVHGIDYRGEQVLAAYRPLTGTGWRLLAKIDQNEVLAQLWTLVFWMSAVILIAVTAVSVVLLLLWRQQQRAHQLALIIHTADQDRLLKYFYDLPFIGMAITSPDTKRWLRFNNQFCEMMGYSTEELAKKSWIEITHPDDVAKSTAERERILKGESEGYAMNKRFIRKDGSIIFANVDVKCVRRDDGTVHYFVAMIRDITEQERRKTEILAARRQLQATLDAIPDLLFELDADGCVHAWHSVRRTEFPTVSGESLVGKKVADFLPTGAVDIILSALAEAQEKGLSSGKQLELRLPGREDKWWFELSVSRKHVDSAAGLRFIVLARDITERKASEQRILHLAHYDSLTGLPNRALLADRMRVAINRAARQAKRLAVLFVDLDRFKAINDSLGHDVGDHLLKVVAERMQTSIRSVDTVSRVGGDEFVVLLNEIETAEDAARVAQKIIDGLSQPYQIEKHELLLTGSIGICIYPDNGKEPNILLRNADASMYTAKEAGHNRYQFYSEDMTARAIERLSLEHDLRGAVERGEMFLVYQPQIELGTSRVIGVEVLMRWRHPARGLISPVRFIPVAEDTGLILSIGEWGLRESCRQAQLWYERGLLNACISVNVSAVQFRQTDFVGIIENALQESGLAPTNLELELTESAVMQGAEPALNKLRELDALGVKVAIDDFGTGYSSLAYLRQFTVDRLKIDQSFVRDVPGNNDAEAIAAAIVAMGLNLGFRIIAEGVETEAQAEFLQSVLCKEGQGYLFAWPMTAIEFEAWIAGWQNRAGSTS
ncbi:EAL domain-containing protein [Nitrosospira multiformis]|uniref:EAL domain-containing protein n=1 Tax=Nitrosospira multiformis TaxID=1231 RepID=UPI0008982245|nr:EAL domain-containing protein [Nitrosospira multiformis]SEA54489.1 PAS domain S-box-containing protein/diguanylate cyclase (GGDEF) domain-containing protein [Nitrosospira multiformis]